METDIDYDIPPNIEDNKFGNIVCPKHPTCPNPYPCLICNEVGQMVCNDCTHDQDYLRTVGILSYDLGTMCSNCISEKSNKCPKHDLPAKGMCFSVNCEVLVCDVCMDEQNYSHNMNDVVYCNECLKEEKKSHNIHMEKHGKEFQDNRKKISKGVDGDGGHLIRWLKKMYTL